jgi:hypothetical protein
MTTPRIASGTYRARAIAGSEQYGTTSNGNDQIVIDLDLLDIGEKVSTFLVFSDKAASYSIDRLRAAGWTGDDLSKLEGLGGAECEVEVKYEDYQGEQKMKVQIRTGGAVKLKDQLDDKGKKAFAAKYRDLAKSVAKPTAPSEPKSDINF